MSDIAAFQYLRRESDDFHELKDRELEDYLNNTVRPRLGKTIRYAVVGSAVTTSGAAESTVASLTVTPAADGVLTVWAHVRVDFSVTTDEFQLRLKDGSTLAAYDTLKAPGAIVMAHPVQGFALTAGTAKTVNATLIRASGTGTGTTYADSNINMLHAIFVPT